MSPLNIHPEEEVAVPKKKKKQNKALKVMLGIAALVAVPVVGTTLAASIAINSGGNVNFGQGSVATAACDSAITTAASSSYETVSGTAAFYLKTITLSGIDLTSGCEGKSFIVSVDGGSGTEVDISSGVKQVSFTIPATAGASSTTLTGVTAGFSAALTNASDVSYKTDSTAVPYDDAAKIVITITAPVFASSSVSKFLVQSS
jgi:hypothetical protein